MMNHDKRQELLGDILIGLMGVVVLVLSAVAIVSCKPNVPETWTGGAINCTTEAVQNNWSRAYPEVQSCLTVLSEDPISCLDALPAIVKVGIDVVACIVRGTGQEAAAQYRSNPTDGLSARKAERADRYIKTKGFVFQ